MADSAGRWPLTYLECRERFRHAARRAGARLSSHGISRRGPAGEELGIDVATLGSTTPSRVLLLVSGVHGVEGFAGSMIQQDLLGRLAEADPLSADTGIVMVHAANPWGMAWWRRANEHNVDLNRNWQDFENGSLPDNEAYATLHPLLCPDDADLPAGDAFVEELGRLSSEHGVSWVRQAISGGQYTHPDGLYFGGARREESTEILGAVANAHLGGAEAVLAIDLHTGHGPRGTYTLLSPAPLGSDADRWIRSVFDTDRVETTGGNPDATSAPKFGQVVPGLLDRVAPDRSWFVTFELGTRSETRVIVAERAEHWVHRFGDRHHPDHAAAVWEHRVCSIPDDEGWEATGLAHGRTVLDRALRELPRL